MAITATVRSKPSSRSRCRASRAAQPGEPIVSDASAPLAQTIDAVRRLDGSYLFIQGPPGAGKTYTGSHVIAALLADGKRVAVSSNSHKAINNLLEAVEEVLIENGHEAVRAGKKSSARDDGQLPQRPADRGRGRDRRPRCTRTGS